MSNFHAQNFKRSDTVARDLDEDTISKLLNLKGIYDKLNKQGPIDKTSMAKDIQNVVNDIKNEANEIKPEHDKSVFVQPAPEKDEYQKKLDNAASLKGIQVLL